MVGLNGIVQILDLSMQSLLRAFAFLLQFDQSSSVQRRSDIGHAAEHGGDQGTVVQAGQAQVAGPGVQFPGELTELGRSHRLVGPTAC